jgi:cytochrome P450
MSDTTIPPLPARAVQLGTPPGPTGERIAGCGKLFQKDPLRFLVDAHREYGDIVRFRLGWQRFYLISHPDDIKWILKDNDQNYGGFLVDKVVQSVLGRSLFMSEGEFWRRHRRMMQPAFHPARVTPVAGITTEMTTELLERLDRRAHTGETFDVMTDMMTLTLRVAAKALFGIQLTNDAETATKAVSDILDYFGKRIEQMPFVLPPAVPTPSNRRFHVARRTLEDTVTRIIGCRRQNSEASDDFLSTLMAATDKATGYRMDDRQIRDEVTAMVIMSHESTADVMTWAWMLLSTHPEAENWLHAELRHVLGGRTPTIEDLPNLPYTNAIVHETMRLYPPGWLLGRRALGDDEIGGYRIPSKSVVVFSPYITHRHPAFWSDPEVFAPERFLDEDKRRPRFAFIPFGGGPHACIGNQFALIECQLVLAIVAQRYRLRLVPGHPVDADALITLRPRHGMRMTVGRV